MLVNIYLQPFIMDFTKNELVKSAGAIINQAGTDALTINKLAVKMGIGPTELSVFFEQDKDILTMMLLSLENEMQELIHDVLVQTQLPEEEISGLFKKLYELLDLKPYYLSIIFAAELMKQDTGIQDILVRIRSAAEIFLLQLVNQGKQQKTFYTGTKTSALVKKILVSFRVLMKDQWLSVKMVRDLEIQRSLNE
jgi:hypothetical protein